jgi:hypothetical protein
VDRDGYDVIDVPPGALAAGSSPRDEIRVYTTNGVRALYRDAAVVQPVIK